MKQYLSFFAVAIFSVFIGSQITEGILLVPYWQSLTSEDFYVYYNEFGPSIAKFYTILTIIAALIPLIASVYFKVIQSNAFKYALLSAIFAILFVASFYIYFKDANALFYQASFNEEDLKSEFIIWSYWHWGRILIECLSLGFLIIAFKTILKQNKS